MANTIEVEFQYMGIAEAPPIDEVYNCQPYNKLIDVIRAFLEGMPFNITWFEFYDSHRVWLWNTQQTVSTYTKTNRLVIYYMKKVPLKFRVPKDLNFPKNWLENWCINHGRRIDMKEIPEIGRVYGFDSEMKLVDVCQQFGDSNGFKYHSLNFFDSTGRLITPQWDINLERFFKRNGPMIFYIYQPNDYVDYFYLNVSYDPHSIPERFNYVEGMTVAQLSREYKPQHSSLMKIDEDGNIGGFVDPDALVEDIYPNHRAYRLGDLHDSHNTSAEHFDVSVCFRNGGDMFINSVLVCVIHEETIRKFCKRLLAKIVRPDQVAVYQSLLRINIFGEYYKCNSTVLIDKPDGLNEIPVFTVDAAALPSDMKYCDHVYEIYFYDKTKPCDKVEFISDVILARNQMQLTSVIDVFIQSRDSKSKNYEFFDSRDIEIDLQETESTVGQYAGTNDLVIYFIETDNVENNNAIET